MSRENMFESSNRNRQKIKEDAKNEREEFLVESLNIAEISDPKFHDRSYVSMAGIDELAENIKSIGYLAQPIVVRPLEDGGYERVIGFRRIEAFKLLGWGKIPARILDLTNDEAVLLMLSENLQRENLNAYDETFSIVQYISISLAHGSIENTMSIFYKIRNFYAGNINGSEELEEQINEIEKILAKLAKYKLNSFLNRLKVLNVEPEIIAAMREDNLPYTYALLINQVRFDKELMTTLIALTLRKLLNFNMLKEKVEAAKKSVNGNSSGSEFSNYKNRAKNMIKKLNNKLFEQLEPKAKKRIDNLLSELEKILTMKEELGNE